MAEPPRVVHVTTHLGGGGAAQNVLRGSIGLAERGYRVTLVHGPSENREEDLIARAIEGGVEFREIPALLREIHAARDRTALREIRTVLSDLRPSLLHTHQSKAGFLGRYAARSLPDTPVVHTPHGHVFYGYFPAWKAAIFVGLERLAAKWTDRLIGLTRKEVDDHLAKGIGDKDRWRVVHSGVDLEKVREGARPSVDVREVLGFPEDSIVLASLGRLEPVKGFLEFLPLFAEAAKKDERLRWVLLGEGTQRTALESRIEELGLTERAHLLGWKEEPFGWLAGCDALAVPSKNEGMGRSIVEAFALGLPVFASRAGSIPELVDNESLGRLFSWRRPEAAAEDLFAFASDIRTDLEAAEARIAKAEEYSLERMIDALVACYEESIEHP